MFSNSPPARTLICPLVLHVVDLIQYSAKSIMVSTISNGSAPRSIKICLTSRISWTDGAYRSDIPTMFPNSAVENVLKRFQTDMELRVGVSYFADLSEDLIRTFCSGKFIKKAIVWENGKRLYLWWNDACRE